MRSKIWSKIIIFICFCVIPKYSVVCINFESDDDPIGRGSPGPEDTSSGFFDSLADLMPSDFSGYFSTKGKENSDNFADFGGYSKGKADDTNGGNFRSFIGNVYDPSPVKNIWDIFKFDSDIEDVRSSNGKKLDDMDYDDDDDDEFMHSPMKLNRGISPSWDKSNDLEDDRMIGKAASMKDSISRLIGIGHKSSTEIPDKAEEESNASKKDDSFEDDDDDDDDDEDDDDDSESNEKTTKMNGKSKGNIFTKWFSKSKTTSSDRDQKATTEASKFNFTTEEPVASNLTTAKSEDDDDDDDEDDEDESSDNSTSHSSTTTKSSKTVSTTVTPLSSTTHSTSTISTTKEGKSHKHEESSSTSTKPEPDDISSTEKVTKKHHRHHKHTSTTAIPSTTVVHKSHKHSKTTSPKNSKDTDGDDKSENKTGHKSSSEIIEAFLASLGHKSDEMKNTSTEATVTKSSKHSKIHKKKHKKSEHKRTTTISPESLSTELKDDKSNSSSTVKPENRSTTDTEVSATKFKGDLTATANLTSITESSASFPIISITRTPSDEKISTTDSSTLESQVNSSSSDDSSKSTSTPEILTLGPYVEESDDVLPTERIVYSDWNPDVFP